MTPETCQFTAGLANGPAKSLVSEGSSLCLTRKRRLQPLPAEIEPAKDAKKLRGSHQGHGGHRGNIKVVRTRPVLAELVFRMAKVSIAGYFIPVIAKECREQTESPFPVKTASVIPAQSDLFVFTHQNTSGGQTRHRLLVSRLPAVRFGDR